MENRCLDIAPVRLLIRVTTGDRKGAGTNATVKIKVFDTTGHSTQELKLSKFGRNDHKRGQTDNFPVPATQVPAEFGETSKVEFWRDHFGIGDDWYLDLITVEDLVTFKKYYFPVHRWIDESTQYRMNVFDTSLPQFDDNQHQRRIELERKQKIYQYAVTSPGAPVQVKTLPSDENFSDSYKFDLGASLLKFTADTKLIELAHGAKKNWESLDELRGEAYKFSMDLPISANPRYWPTDLWFGCQRVQGCNPTMIRLCHEIPSNFALEKARVEEILETTVDKALQCNRIFIVDLKVLENVPCKEGRTVCAPIALFYLDKEKNLLPLAIQLSQRSSATSPVFYPTDETSTWTLAKMWYNNADSSYHQSCTHLGFTHLLMEGVAVCTNRHLSPSHPIFKLLAPHFLYIMAINTLAVQKLLNNGGWVDKATSIGVPGMLEVVSRGVKQWNLERDAIPFADCKSREVLDPKVLPCYPYRDDAIAVFDAIKEYVTTIVNHFYETSEQVANDFELRNWAQELVLDKSLGGVGIQGVPGNGTFTTVDQIVTTMSAIIFTCSVAHAAANFNQYDEYGFGPNYPILLAGQVPTKKNGYTERDIVQQLPTKSETLETLVITRLLSSKGTNSLGQFEVQYLYDPVSVEAATQLRERLQCIGGAIRKRNNDPKTKFQYPWLDPEGIPNSISI